MEILRSILLPLRQRNTKNVHAWKQPKCLKSQETRINWIGRDIQGPSSPPPGPAQHHLQDSHRVLKSIFQTPLECCQAVTSSLAMIFEHLLGPTSFCHKFGGQGIPLQAVLHHLPADRGCTWFLPSSRSLMKLLVRTGPSTKHWGTSLVLPLKAEAKKALIMPQPLPHPFLCFYCVSPHIWKGWRFSLVFFLLWVYLQKHFYCLLWQ